MNSKNGPKRFLGLLDEFGHGAVSIGNPDTARRNAIFIPGTGQDLTRLTSSDEKSLAMYTAAMNADPSLEPEDVAVTTWMGYDRPMELGHAAFPEPAYGGADGLDTFENGLRASHVGPPSIDTVIGHSYGSTVVGAAASGGHHLDADNVIAVGSPGMLVDRAGRLNLHAGAGVYVMSADNDIIGMGGVVTEWTLGADPTDPGFGAKPSGGRSRTRRSSRASQRRRAQQLLVAREQSAGEFRRRDRRLAAPLRHRAAVVAASVVLRPAGRVRATMGTPPSPGATDMGWFSAPEYWLSRLILERGIAAVYVFAFVAAARQFRALIGEHGLLPVPHYLARQSFIRTPSIFHVHYSDRFFATVAWSGAALAAAMVAGLADVVPLWAAVMLWLLLWVALSVDRQRRPDVVLVRLGVAAAGDGFPGDLSSAMTGSRRRCWRSGWHACCCSGWSSVPG